MPNIKSATKRLRQNKKRKARNFAIKAKIKEIGKEIIKKLSANQSEEAKKDLNMYFKTVDKAVSRGILKKNTGARRKSTFARAIFSQKKSVIEEKDETQAVDSHEE